MWLTIPVPLPASLTRTVVRFGNVTIVLFTGIPAEEKTVPGELQCKKIPASTAFICGSVLLSSLLLLQEYFPTSHQVLSHQGSYDMQKPCLYHDGCLHTEDGTRHSKLFTASTIKVLFKTDLHPPDHKLHHHSAIYTVKLFILNSCLVEKDMCCSLSLLGYHVTYPMRLQQHGQRATMGRAGIS